MHLQSNLGKWCLILGTVLGVSYGAPVTCDVMSSYQCMANFTQGYQALLQSVLQTPGASLNITDMSVIVPICSMYHNEYLPCVQPFLAGCSRSQTITHDVVKATAEYFCNAQTSVVQVTLQCLGKPGVASSIALCTANIAPTLSNLCSGIDSYTDCIHNVTQTNCSPEGQDAVRDFTEHIIKPATALAPCNDTQTPSTSAPVVHTNVPVTAPSRCGQECIMLLESVSTAAYPKLANYSFTLTHFLQGCSNYSLYEDCMEDTDCDREELSHTLVSEFYDFVCESASEILSHNDCWEKAEVKEVFSNCYGIGVTPSPVQGDICSSNLRFFNCITEGVRGHCSFEAVKLAADYVNAQAKGFADQNGCATLSVQPEVQTSTRASTPEPETGITATPEPEAEGTATPATPEPEAEGTAVPSTPEPEAEGTASPATPEPEAEGTAAPATPESEAEGTATPATPEPEAEGTASPATPEPEAEGTASPATPEPEAEGTASPATPEPEAEGTASPATPEPEAEGTAAPATPEPEAEATNATTLRTTTASRPNTTTIFATTFPTPVTSSNSGGPVTCRPCSAIMNSILTSIAASNVEGTFTFLEYTDACPVFVDYLRCKAEQSANCSSGSGISEAVERVFRYTCGAGYTAIVSQASCWTKPELQMAWKTCSDEFTEIISNNADFSELCRGLDTLEQCAVNSAMLWCGQNAADITEKVFSISIQSQRVFYQCPKETVNICYDCHSGYSAYQNPNCPIDGDVTSRSAVITCKDRCFTRTNKWNKGVIFRGCAAGFYFPKERPLPRSGCHTIRGEVWCFCDGNKCNTMNMNRFLIEDPTTAS